MKINKTITFIFFSIFLTVNAQKYKLGSVTVEELQQKSHPIDTAASAAIIFKKGKTSFNLNASYWQIITEVSFKIKIYKKEGLKYANQKVDYYIGGNKTESVHFSNASTYNLVNGKVVQTKLKSEGEFTKVINDNWKEKSLAFPDVKEGSIIEFTYKLYSPYIHKFNDWYFQSDIPTDYVEYNAYMIKYFTYNTVLNGYVKIDVKSEALTSSNYGEVKYIYTKQNIPAIKEESYVDNIDNYTSILKFNLASVEFPNEPKENRALDWEGVAKTIYGEEDFGIELKKTGYFEDDLKPIISGLKNRDEKIDAILKFVKSKVKWNNKYGYSCNDGVKTAYKNKTGNVAEINLMLTAMLRYAEIDANPVLLSTKSYGVSVFPSLTAFNYVIAAVEIQDDLILLDATEKFSTPNILPIRDLNWFGRLIRKEGTSAEVDLATKKISEESVFMTYRIDATGAIDGQLRHRFSNHEALRFREKNAGSNIDSYLEKLENSNNNIEINDYKRDNELDITKPVIETYSFKDKNSSEVIGDKIYISPSLFLTESENPFKQEKREYPVDFQYPYESKYHINLDIPEGYIVESIPSEVNLTTGDGIGFFKYMIVILESKIQVQLTTNINSAIVATEYYEVLKEFFKKMIDKQNEKIVLKKV